MLQRVRVIRVGIALALLAGGAAPAAAQTTMAATVPVKTDAGPVTGVVAGDVAAYKGIPSTA